MKRLIKYILLISVVFAFTTSCDEDSTEDISRITYYPEFEMTGDQYYFIDIGGTYEEPGIKAFSGEEELDVTIEGDDAIDTDSSAIYTVTYTATNADGYDKSVERYVVVKDGDLTATDFPTGEFAGGYYGDGTMTVTQEKTGIYKSTDIFGYGDPYPTPGTYVDRGNGNLTVMPTSSAFGATLQSRGNYTSNQISYLYGISGYGYIFPVTWTK